MNDITDQAFGTGISCTLLSTAETLCLLRHRKCTCYGIGLSVDLFPSHTDAAASYRTPSVVTLFGCD